MYEKTQFILENVTMLYVNNKDSTCSLDGLDITCQVDKNNVSIIEIKNNTSIDLYIKTILGIKTMNGDLVWCGKLNVEVDDATLSISKD